VDPPGGGRYMIEWQPKVARDASALAASLPDDDLDLTGLVATLRRQPTSGAPRSYRVAEFTQAVDPGQTAVADHLRRAPDGLFDDGAVELEGPRWVIAGEASLGELWAHQAGRRARRMTYSGWLWSHEAQQDMRALRAIDFFGDLGSSSGESGRDPLGTQLVTRFLAFLRALAAARKGQACTPCRLTIITRHAAFDVRTPREALLWGVGRTLGRDLDPTLGLDVRLLDIGGPTDLPMVGWLARHDVRERALAIRKGRLHAPRLVRRTGTYATVAASG
jgi:hypothetical protein